MRGRPLRIMVVQTTAAVLLACLGATLVVAFQPEAILNVSTLEQPRSLDRGQGFDRVIEPGQSQEYKITLAKGASATVDFERRGADIVVNVFDPAGRQRKADSVQDLLGTKTTIEITARAAGVYRIAVRLSERQNQSGRYSVQPARRTSADELAHQKAVAVSSRRAAVGWLSANAVALKSVDADGDFADLQPLKPWIGNAHIVSMGEATHGTREFFQMKRRMFEFLVDQMGFTVFAFEASQPELFDLDRYVLTGEGNARGALAAQYFWCWDTREVLGLIEWMRAYNADPKHVRKLRFYGFDMQSPTRAAKVAVEYLSRVSPQLGAEMRTTLASVLDPFLAGDFSSWPVERRTAVKAAAQKMLADLDAHRAAYVVGSGEDTWALARQHARVLLQCFEMRLQTNMLDLISYRDRAMADNVDWILQREGPSAKIALWAHNGHVARTGQFRTMGQYLDERHGKDMFVFGFAFNQGGFQTREMPLATKGELKTFIAAPAPVDSLDGTLAAAGLKIAAINLHSIPDRGPVAEWFRAAHGTRGRIGAAILPERVDHEFDDVQITQLYDGLFFTETTTAAQPNSTQSYIDVMLPVSTNGGFEEGCGNGTIPGWTADRDLPEFAFDISAVRGGAAAGECALRIKRLSGVRYGEVARGVSQRVSAQPFRNHRLTVSAMISERLHADGIAYLWVRVMQSAGQSKNPFEDEKVAFYDYRAVKPAGDSPVWRPCTLTADVPENASAISYGFSLVGGGEFKVDDVVLRAAAADADGK